MQPQSLAATPQHRYMVQLDGLRAFAVLGVMLEHWIPHGQLPNLPFGAAGVHLFFVLSGFLITGILLNTRDEADRVGQSLTTTLYRFYVRRFLRIFPLYYAAVLIAAWMLLEGRATLWPNLLYVSNFTQWHDQRWAGAVSHFWSLAVEEQFYLVWPVALLGLPRRALGLFVWATIVAAPLFRVAMAISRPDDHFFDILPVSCLDALGLGAALAMVQRRHSSARFEWICLTIGLPLWIATRTLIIVQDDLRAITALELTAMSLVFTWLIGRASRSATGTLAGRLLSLRPIVYLGTISYGLYVVHNLIDPLILRQTNVYPIPAIRNDAWIGFIARFCLTVAIASVSWFFFERPINNLKRHVPYTARRREPAGSTVRSIEPASELR